MLKIDMQSDVKFGEEQQHTVTAIHVHPIRFAEFVQVWSKPHVDPKKPALSLQKARILHQAHFMVGKERYVPGFPELGQVDFRTVRQIIDALDLGQGTPGKLLNDNDGLSKPILYKLGDPIKMTSGRSDQAGADKSISELEFQGTTYAALEDVLAADNELEQTLALLHSVAKPVGHDSLSFLTPGIVERMSMADGVTIMKDVLPRF